MSSSSRSATARPASFSNRSTSSPVSPPRSLAQDSASRASMGRSPRIAGIASRSRQSANPAGRIPTNRSLPCHGRGACGGSSPSIRTRPDRDPPQMRRQAQGDRLHRGSRRRRHHPCAHSTTRGGRTVAAARATPAHLDTPNRDRLFQNIARRRSAASTSATRRFARVSALFRHPRPPGAPSAAPPGVGRKPSLSAVLRRPRRSGGYSSYARHRPSGSSAISVM